MRLSILRSLGFTRSSLPFLAQDCMAADLPGVGSADGRGERARLMLRISDRRRFECCHEAEEETGS